MTRIIVAYLAAAVAMAVLDIAWLTTVMRGLFEGAVGEMLAPRANLAPAVLFYVLYVAGIVFFAVSPALRAGSWAMALGLGLALGLVCYMTYDLTNLATLKAWPARIAALDIVWGMLLTAVSSGAGYFAASRIA